MNKIQSRDYDIGSYRINKLSLWSYGDKRYILKDIVGYHIFIDLPINYMKILLSKIDNLF